MASDVDWVADVRRWYFSGRQQPAPTAPARGDAAEVGYEAADPALQSPHWPDAPRAGITDPA
ncbi:MAG TPA: hypothetical protein VFA35_00615 [Burkholderiaceae bacterium]|nr:hypothetical protein [Burkholderiaceae bacterium]